MTETENLALEQLRLIRKDIGELKAGQAQIRIEISALGQQFAGLTTAVYAGHDRLRDFERRIEHIERRLDLAD